MLDEKAVLTVSVKEYRYDACSHGWLRMGSPGSLSKHPVPTMAVLAKTSLEIYAKKTLRALLLAFAFLVHPSLPRLCLASPPDGAICGIEWHSGMVFTATQFLALSLIGICLA